MRCGIRKEIDWEYVGATLANSGDDEQALFIKAFIKECKSWGTRFQIEQQFASVNNKLDDDEKYLLGVISFNGDES